jgi:hypothetical protein
VATLNVAPLATETVATSPGVTVDTLTPRSTRMLDVATAPEVDALMTRPFTYCEFAAPI